MFQVDFNGGDEVNDTQKIKIMTTLSEFIDLNRDRKPIIFDPCVKLSSVKNKVVAAKATNQM